jgi:hypothetical protein
VTWFAVGGGLILIGCLSAAIAMTVGHVEFVRKIDRWREEDRRRWRWP